MFNQRRRILSAIAAIPLGILALRAMAKDSLFSSANLLASSVGVPPTDATPAVNILADLRHKPGYTINSWFAVGHFASKGHTLNYLVHLFALSIKGKSLTNPTLAIPWQ